MAPLKRAVRGAVDLESAWSAVGKPAGIRQITGKTVMQRLVIGMAMAAALTVAATVEAVDNPTVIMEVSDRNGLAGDVIVELFSEEAPVSTDNFLEYVDSEFYDGLIFHRVVAGFVVQGMNRSPLLEALA